MEEKEMISQSKAEVIEEFDRLDRLVKKYFRLITFGSWAWILGFWTIKIAPDIATNIAKLYTQSIGILEYFRGSGELWLYTLDCFLVMAAIYVIVEWIISKIVNSLQINAVQKRLAKSEVVYPEPEFVFATVNKNTQEIEFQIVKKAEYFSDNEIDCIVYAIDKYAEANNAVYDCSNFLMGDIRTLTRIDNDITCGLSNLHKIDIKNKKMAIVFFGERNENGAWTTIKVSNIFLVDKDTELKTVANAFLKSIASDEGDAYEIL